MGSKFNINTNPIFKIESLLKGFTNFEPEKIQRCYKALQP